MSRDCPHFGIVSLPAAVSENRSVPLGQYQGLHFGLFLSPHGSPDVFVEGATTRLAPLSTDHHGPRAILNAVERIIGAYDAERARARNDLTIARHQLRDYAARMGAAFPHGAYVSELTELHDRLKAALANPAQKARRFRRLPSASRNSRRHSPLRPRRSVRRHAPPPRRRSRSPRVFSRIQETPTPEPEQSRWCRSR